MKYLLVSVVDALPIGEGTTSAAVTEFTGLPESMHHLLTLEPGGALVRDQLGGTGTVAADVFAALYVPVPPGVDAVATVRAALEVGS